MERRLELHEILCGLLGSRKVYYNPPESLKMEYPAIRYSKKDIQGRFADNRIYSKMTCYELIVISKTADHEVIDKLMELPYISFDRHYKSDNLNHDVLTLYF